MIPSDIRDGGDSEREVVDSEEPEEDGGELEEPEESLLSWIPEEVASSAVDIGGDFEVEDTTDEDSR